MVKKIIINKKSKEIESKKNEKVKAVNSKFLIYRELILFGMSIILIVAFGMSPLAYVNYGNVSVAVILIPIILTILLLDKYIYAILIGLSFGITSIVAAYVQEVTELDKCFKNPLVSIVPRILMAIFTLWIFNTLRKKIKLVDRMSAFVCSFIASLIGVAANTAITINFLLTVYGKKLGCVSLSDKINYAFQFLVGINPLLELLFTSITVSILYVLLSKKKIVTEKDNIKVLFQKWLLLVILVSFLATYYISYCITTYYARVDATRNIELNINDIEIKLSENLNRLDEINEDTKKTLLGQAKVLALLMQKDPSLLKKENGPKYLCDIVGINEIAIFDETETVEYAYPKIYEGQHVEDYDVLKKYRGLISGEIDEVLEDVRVSIGNYENDENDEKVYQMFAGVPRLDKKGFIQVAYSSEQYNKLAKGNSLDKIAKTFRIGNDGGIAICRDDIIISTNKDGYIGVPISNVLKKIDKDIYSKNGLIATINSDELLLFGKNIDNYMIIGFLPTAEVYAKRNVQCVFLIVCDVLLFGIVYYMILRLMDRVVVNEVNKINISLEKITNGNLSEIVDAHSTTEFDALSNDINATVGALKNMINVEKSRMEKDLELAKAIQTSALPSVFPAFPERNEFDIYASMDTAKEVGGDFYDFFFIRQNKLVFLIADVSGKGIPAAMFMMRAKAVIKSLAETGVSLNKVAEETNRLLCENNEASMFVTAWLGLLDTDNNKLTYVNCGHNPPIYIDRNGEKEWLKDRSGFILGTMENMKYKEFEKQLYKGDKLYLYTDGVTESINNDKQMYGEDRLIDALDKSSNMSLFETLMFIRSDIEKHSDGYEQFDDITMLILEIVDSNKKIVKLEQINKQVEQLENMKKGMQDKQTEINGSNEMKNIAKKNIIENKLIIESKEENLGVVLNYILDKIKDMNISFKIRNNIEVSVEEVYVNISHYAYGSGNTGRCEVKAYVIDNSDNIKEMVIEFIDEGIRYNPLEKEDPNITLAASERPIGGLGIFLVKKLMDSVSYNYDEINKRNILILKKKLMEREDGYE